MRGGTGRRTGRRRRRVAAVVLALVLAAAMPVAGSVASVGSVPTADGHYVVGSHTFRYGGEGSTSTFGLFVGNLRPTDDVHGAASAAADRSHVAPLGSFEVTSLSDRISLYVDDEVATRVPVTVRWPRPADAQPWVDGATTHHCVPVRHHHVIGGLQPGWTVTLSLWGAATQSPVAGCGEAATAGEATVDLWAPIPEPYRVVGSETVRYATADRNGDVSAIAYRAAGEAVTTATGDRTVVNEFTVVPPGDRAAVFVDNSTSGLTGTVRLVLRDHRGWRHLCVPVRSDAALVDLAAGAATTVVVGAALASRSCTGNDVTGGEPGVIRLTFFERRPGA